MDKMRINGETIDPSKQYSGRHVLALLKASYENGCHSERMRIGQSENICYSSGYQEGYEDGYKEASSELTQFKELLRRIMDCDAD